MRAEMLDGMIADGGGILDPPPDLAPPSGTGDEPHASEDRYIVPPEELGEVWVSDSDEMDEMRRQIDLYARASAVVMLVLPEAPPQAGMEAAAQKAEREPTTSPRCDRVARTALA